MSDPQVRNREDQRLRCEKDRMSVISHTELKVPMGHPGEAFQWVVKYVSLKLMTMVRPRKSDLVGHYQGES